MVAHSRQDEYLAQGQGLYINCVALSYFPHTLKASSNPPPPTTPTPNAATGAPRGLAKPCVAALLLHKTLLSFSPSTMKMTRTSRSGLPLLWVVGAAVLGAQAVGAQRGPLEGLGARFQSVGYEINSHSKFGKMSTMSADSEPAAGGRPKL